MIGLPELKGEVTVVTESATVTRNMAEKSKKCPRKVSNAPDKKKLCV